MWKPLRNVTEVHAPRAAIRYDKFHVLRHLTDAMDQVRKAEYKRLTNRPDRTYIQGQKYVLRSHREQLSPDKRRALQTLVAANTRLNTAYVLKEPFGQRWDYRREPWARTFFDPWTASLRWQRLKPCETFAAMIERHWDGIAAYCRPENQIAHSNPRIAFFVIRQDALPCNQGFLTLQTGPPPTQAATAS